MEQSVLYGCSPPAIDALNLSNNHFDLVEDLVSVLRDHEPVTTRLISELYPTLSLLLLLELKRRFSLECRDLESKAVLAAALDPCSRGLTFLSDGERKKVEECLVCIMGAEVQQSNKKQVKQLESDRLDQLSGFVKDDGDEDSVAAQGVRL